MSSTCTAVIVGSEADPHVRAVAAELPAPGLVIIDAESLSRVVQRIGLHESRLVDVAGNVVALNPLNPVRGWIRRFAPADWDDKVVLGSHRAALLASRLDLLAAVMRDDTIQWITDLDHLAAAENKILQYRAASKLGITAPQTVVDFDADLLAEQLGSTFILKPIGPGNYADDQGRQRVVYATVVGVGDLDGVDLSAAPYIGQALVVVRHHLRAVTVGDNAWVTELEAAGVPTDWRRQPRAHDGFQATTSFPQVSKDAVRLARHMGVGHSSQDWVIDANTGEHVFLDLNPGGQWLFLPSEVTDRVAADLATWMKNPVVVQ